MNPAAKREGEQEKQKEKKKKQKNRHKKRPNNKCKKVIKRTRHCAILTAAGITAPTVLA